MTPDHPPAHDAPTLVSVGHGTLDADELVSLLRAEGVESLVDIRTAPGSRRFPHFGQTEMQRWLPAAGIGYRWERDLGGFRRTTPESPNVALRNPSFRGYGDYMESATFWSALDRLLAEAASSPTAMMCSESLWWRCHRRLVSDTAVLARQVPVVHLMHDGSRTDHVVTDGARLTGEGMVRYDVGQASLLAEDDG